MKNTNKKLNHQIKVIKAYFSGSCITKYSGITKIASYFKRKKIDKQLNNIFVTKKYNATKISIVQILLSIVFASLSGINRLSKIANFTQDPLIKTTIGLEKSINENIFSRILKKLSQTGARKLQKYLLELNSKYLENSKLETITIDADSTVSMVYGNQQGAEKGYNPIKKGAKSYHPLLAFVSELKLLYHSWFRTGSAYTSNGIVEMLKEIKASLPQTIKKVFFRADSGFFDGSLFDLLEFFGWEYLVKVKLKNLEYILKNQIFKELEGHNGIAICEFDYSTKSWNGKVRKLKAIRQIKKYEQREFFGEKQIMPVYEYFCYISSYEDKNAYQLHQLYQPRATSETWIEQVKSQLLAGKTLTDNFWANDILWQLNCFAYNISVMIRNKHQIAKRQEHSTFRDWFIAVPGKIVKTGRQIELKIYESYYYKSNWVKFSQYLETI
jgi:hypothetical protein